MSVVRIVGSLVLVLSLLILARVVSSWVDPGGRRPLSRWLVHFTEPILAPVRRVLPRTGAVDFGPMIVRIVLGLILEAIRA